MTHFVGCFDRTGLGWSVSLAVAAVLNSETPTVTNSLAKIRCKLYLKTEEWVSG